MNPLPVSAGGLARRTIRFQDATLTNCALLPLFDGRGVTARVIVLSADTRECRVFDWWPGLVHVPLLGAARVDALWATPQRMASGGRFWFYDRRGVAESCTTSLRGDLNLGNCASVLPKRVAGVFWWRDLSRICGVWLKKQGGVELGRWKPDWLPAAPPGPMVKAPVRPAHGWVLHPAWAR